MLHSCTSDAFQIRDRFLDHTMAVTAIDKSREVIDFRNVLIHGYAVVIADRAWDYAKNDLPQLHQILQALLDEMEPPEA